MKKLLLMAVSATALAVAPALADDSTSTVNQSGTSGTATVDQSGTLSGGSDSLINQAGDTNTSTVTQSSGASAGDGGGQRRRPRPLAPALRRQHSYLGPGESA